MGIRLFNRGQYRLHKFHKYLEFHVNTWKKVQTP